MRSLTCEVLSALGFRATPCATRGEATAIVEGGGVDAILTDIGLEGNSSGGGLELCTDVQRMFPEVAVFVLSGDHTARSAAVAAGAEEFWVKPANLKMIATTIHSYLNGSNQP